ncbi:ATP-binding cassette domain-containing protein [Staphylococcus aureus]
MFIGLLKTVIKILVEKDINIHINAGEFIAIMGPSGSGKSTLINILGFIDESIMVNICLKEVIQRRSDNQLANIRNKTVGFVFQNFKLIHNGVLL